MLTLDPTTPDPIIIGPENGWQVVSDAQACGIYLRGSLRFLAFGASRVGAFERAAMQAFRAPMNESWHHAHARIHEARRVLMV